MTVRSAAFPALLLLVLNSCTPAHTPTVADADTFLKKAESELEKLTIMDQHAEWVAETYINGDTEIITAAANEAIIKRTTELIQEGKPYESLNLPPDLKRKFLLLKLSLVMPAPDDAKLREELTHIASSLERRLWQRQILPSRHRQMPRHRRPRRAHGQSPRPQKARRHVGRLAQGRRAHARPLCPLRRTLQQGARELGFADTGALWRSNYDMTPEQFSAELERLWTQVEPLYKELHAYVRRKLIAKYGAAADRPDGMIPADLLGNMWAQEWGNIYDLVAPPAAPATYDIGQILQAAQDHAEADGPVWRRASSNRWACSAARHLLAALHVRPPRRPRRRLPCQRLGHRQRTRTSA